MEVSYTKPRGQAPDYSSPVVLRRGRCTVENFCNAIHKDILKQFKNLNRNRLSIYSFWVDLDMSDNQHLYAALKKTLQHIQQRKARNEVSQENEASTSLGNGLTRKLTNSRLNLKSRSGSRLEGLLSMKSVDSEFSRKSAFED